MKMKYTIAGVAGIALAVAAVAQVNDIVAWGDGTPGTHFIIDDLARTIVVLRGDGNSYKFYAQDSAQAQNLGIIDSIVVDSGAMGNFTLLIDHPSTSPDLPGALHWKAGDLRYAGGTCTITGVHLAGNLCADATAVANIFAENISGDITVGGSLSLAGALDSMTRKLEAQTVVGNITLGGLVGDLDFGSFDGALTVGEDAGGRTGGDVIIHSSSGGGMSFTDSQGFTGSIRIEGDSSGLSRTRTCLAEL